ncbi:MAG: hypothetical protein WEE89_08495 [Gemmatimonadota bacterium]
MSRSRVVRFSPLLLVVAALAAWVVPDPNVDANGMKLSAAAPKSMGAMTFGPNNTLFVGDVDDGSILALQIDDAATAGGAINVTGVDAKIAQLLGTTPQEIVINDLAVHPVSKNVYLTVTRGRGAGATPVLFKVTRNASRPIEEVSLANVRFSVASIPNAPASNPTARRNPRTQVITDIAFADGQVWVAGLSNEEFSSAFRRIPFPFNQKLETTTLEIYHVSHGQNETNAPVMTFLPTKISGTPYILAAYTCTPLVAFEAQTLKNGQHVFGRTVAELGAGNRPLDMISYQRDGKDVILIANSSRPLMRVEAAAIANGQALKSPTKELGITRSTIEQPGVSQLSDLDNQFVVVLQAGKEGGLDLRSIAKSTL